MTDANRLTTVRSAVRRLRGSIGRTLGVTIRRTPDPWEAFRRDGYSQVGEDIVVSALFYGKSTGFYVDVGAHHPWRYSNTFMLYRQGWRGINIDARPGSMVAFDRFRPRDINLEVAVAERAGTLMYYQYDEPLVNTLSAGAAESNGRGTKYKLVATTQVHARPLSEILVEHLPAGQPIDFINIDAEGLDADVIRSNDWDRFRPTLVLAEDSSVNFMSQIGVSEVCRQMEAVGFLPISKLVHTLVFADAKKFHVTVDGLQYVEGSAAQQEPGRI